MKIGEVCDQTGLKEETIKLYWDKGLISNHNTNISSNELVEFTEQQVNEISEIVTLRKAFFSIEDIASIKKYPWNTPGIIDKWYKSLQEDRIKRRALIDCVKDVDFYNVTFTQLAASIQFASKGLPLPKLDQNPNEELAILKETERLKNKDRRLLFKGKLIIQVVVGLLLLDTGIYLINIIFRGSSFIAVLIQGSIRLAMVYALYKGVEWVRYIYIVICIAAVIFGLITLPEYTGLLTYIAEPAVKMKIIILLGINVFNCLLMAVIIVLLLFHKGVKEFFYFQQTRS